MNERGQSFIDYYELMQISPNAELETIQRVFGMLAERYQPSNPKTGDPDLFVRLKQAYDVLSQPAARTAYDRAYQRRGVKPITVFESRDFDGGFDGEPNRRMGILCLLYSRRRLGPESPGLSILAFETIMALPRERLMFTVWYLKDKNYIRQDERSDFVITADGCDYVEANLSSHQALYKLLKAAETGDLFGGEAAGQSEPPSQS